MARQRVEILLESAISYASKDLGLAKRQAELARRICMRYNLRMPYRWRQLFCHGCKSFIVPGLNARVRLSQTPKAVKITCLECGYTYRKILSVRRGAPSENLNR